MTSSDPADERPEASPAAPAPTGPDPATISSSSSTPGPGASRHGRPSRRTGLLRRRDDSPRPLHGSADEVEHTLRARLGLRPLGEVLDPRARVLGWVVPLLVGLVAAVIRLPRLGIPERLAFDETYYVKEAYSLLTLGYEGDWVGDDANPLFADADFSALTSDPDYVVHPPLGKWIIALGMRLLGPENPESWRIASALAGIVMVVLVARLGARLFRSPLLGGVAGLLLALDGVGITASRIGLLDIFLALLVLVGTMLVVKDRESTRAILARRSAEAIARSGTGLLPRSGAPSVGMRWWLVAAGVVLGAACGVKWSGAYAVAVLGLMIFVWDTAARRAVGARAWLSDGVWRGGAPAFFALVPTAALAYVASWASWFASSSAFHRTWAADQRAAGIPTGYPSWLPDSFVSWWDYHAMMMEFHTGLVNPHESQGHPLVWLLQLRPTLFYRAGGEERTTLGMCGDEQCIAGVTSMGNPLIWWLAVVGLGVVLYAAFRLRDWRAWVVLSGYLSMWLPWVVLYSHRTIFQFYSIAFVAFVVLALTYALGWVLGILRPPTDAPVPRGEPRESEVARWRWLRGHFARVVPFAQRPAVPDVSGAVPAGPGTGSDVPDDGRRPDGERGTPGDRPPAARPGLLALAVSEDASTSMGRTGWIALGVVLVSVIAVSAWYYPAWTAWNLTEAAWELRVWGG
ncbi:dolichyl-phosphate-mannose--protein mannosyltransferase [Georgenia sp. Z1491]|uniref:dolichyl-phosphate-mannose--protein mannosyltransferase n=1 Tax=Georgenia sp. Z1491 TaxID=3416707 RepID=UPI003CF44AD1